MQMCSLQTRCLRSALLCLSFFLFTACAALPPRQPLTQEDSIKAVVTGFPANIRFWSDEAPKNTDLAVEQNIKLFHKTHAAYFRAHKTYPPLTFLALSGGGNDGAFGAGILKGWSESGKRPVFSLVTGVSTGALTAPFAFMGQAYDQELEDLFTKTKTDTIFLSDLWTLLSGLAGGLALTDSTPFTDRIEKTYTLELLNKIGEEHRKGRRLYIGTTNLEAQRGVIWSIGALALCDNPDKLKLFHKIIQASAAIPGVFDPVFFDVTVDGKPYNEIHVDGGVIAQVFVYPLRLSRQTVDAFKQSKIPRNLYIIRNSKTTPDYKVIEPGLFSISERSVESLIKNNGTGDLYRLYVGAERDGVRYHDMSIPASFNAVSTEMFDPTYMKQLFSLGRELGRDEANWQPAPPYVVLSNN